MKIKNHRRNLLVKSIVHSPQSTEKNRRQKRAFTPTPKSSVWGFTLIEVVIALLVLTVGIVGVLTVLPVALKASKRAMNMIQAPFFAQEKLEELKRDGYDALQEITETACSNPKFSYTVDVVDEASPPNLRKVTVTISWSEGNQDYDEEFTTLITKY